ncbi:hypothetical protein CJD36_013175 [Flavipsychrobacter stenotrophus]|uniref:Uncharacterized protein n=1 Tax=Flavipsychrobacter stenotrophus TaxID=2077091 RepID=A0A2S7SWD1_9BACT|nr:hypothetical protein [Flavipsychrobacter stenotrophus]PQJ10917.1 hypothetical protein CJD36_013175 [Flavipsychrobacter stenotrophus]
MIDYKNATVNKLKTIVAESNDYAYENVLVAICELRQRGIDIPQSDIEEFCIKYRLPGIEAGMADFFKGNNVTSYEEYYRKSTYGNQPTQAPLPQSTYQQPIMQHQPAQQQYNSGGGNASIREAGSALIGAAIWIVINFILTFCVAMYWQFKMLDIAAGKETPGSLLFTLLMQGVLLLLAFGAVVYKLAKAGMKLREA